MQKIMFNDRYGLTEAVLRGRKTQTRRDELTEAEKEKVNEFLSKECKIHLSYGISERTYIQIRDKDGFAKFTKLTRYHIGEIVAVAQSYKDAGVRFLSEEDEEFGCHEFPAEQTNGWTNKMFVRADLMPHKIRITNIRIERLQDISDHDCMREGIKNMPEGGGIKPYTFYDTKIHIKNDKEDGYGWYVDFDTPREAFAALIDRVSGKGTWERNPYVVVYDYELVK